VATTVPLYALSGVARSAATRSGYVSGTVYITVGGVEVGEGHAPDVRALVESLRVQETINETPNVAQVRVVGLEVLVGAEVLITRGSRGNSDPTFAGRVLSLKRAPLLTGRATSVDLNLIDYQWGLSRYVVTGHYTGSASTIADALIAEYAPGYTTGHVPRGLPQVDGGITFTNQRLPTALTNLAKRVNANWYVDYTRAIHMYPALATDPSIPPTPDVTPSNPRVLLDGFTVDRDLSQMITRVYVEGGGSNADEYVGPGETIIPVTDALWYEDGGTVVAGPQRITYTSRALGIGGSLVGPGVMPSGAPTLALTAGAGIDAGTHEYAIAFVTADGSTLPGPRATIVVGLVPAPAAPGAALAGGSGVDPGTHYYACTFVTASGETTPGTVAEVTTTVQAPPANAPAMSAEAGAGVDNGPHKYVVTWVVEGDRETTPGPESATVTAYTDILGGISEPQTNPTVTATSGTSSLGSGLYIYAVSFVKGAGETPAGPAVGVQTTTGIGNPPAPGSDYPKGFYVGPSAPILALTNGATYRWKFTYRRQSDGAETAPSAELGQPFGPIQEAGAKGAVAWPAGVGFALPSAPSGYDVVYYRAGGAAGSTFKRTTVTTVPPAETSVPAVYDNTPDNALGPAVGSSNQTDQRRVNVTAIPTGPSGTTARRIWRTVADGGQLYLHSTLSNNTTTSITDTLADSGLTTGTTPPPTNTTGTAAPRCVIAVALPIPSDPAVLYKRLYRSTNGAAYKRVGDTLARETGQILDTTPYAALGAPVPAVNAASLAVVRLTLPQGAPIVSHVRIYGTAAGVGALGLVATIANGTATYDVTTPDSGLGAAPPATNTAAANRVQVSNIPLGQGANVTGRIVCRTKADLSTLYVLATIADNATTGYADAAPDSVLTVEAPADDTSGLTQPPGVVLAGSESILVATVRDFSPGGGWARLGNGDQLVRYAGLSGNALIGIRTSGVGALTSSVSYGSSVTPVPHLAGIPAIGPGAIRYQIIKGDPVNLWVQLDDDFAQTQLRGHIGGDGILEDYLQDRRLSAAEARSRGTAHLGMRNQINMTVRYVTRDVSRAGANVTINFGPPLNVAGTFTIQSVAIAEFPARAGGPSRGPYYHVEASETRFSFNDLLRLGNVPGLQW
jgi:hypothetical protein